MLLRIMLLHAAKQPALQQMMREDPELAQQLWLAIVAKHSAKQ